MSSVDDVFISSVRDVSDDGNGIAVHPSGRIFFVPGVWSGDVGRFRTISFKKGYGFAKLEELLESSSSRITPKCSHHGFATGKCGNCPWQFINYKEQLKAKSQRLLDGIERSELCSPSVVKSIWKSPQEYGYRNRAQLKTDGDVLGYVSSHSHIIAPIESCPILTYENQITLQQLLNTLPRKDFEPTNGQFWNTIDIDDNTGYDDLELNQPRLFRQGNTYQNERMKKWLAERLAPLNRNKSVLELFSGTGNFTAVISQTGFKQILAVDGHKKNLDELTAKNLPCVRTIRCNLVARKGFIKIAKAITEPEVLVLDPPRGGLKNRKEFFHQFGKITDIFYISCDVRTFVRDLKGFNEHGFSIVEIQPLDLFPHTPHVEMLGYLKRL